MKSNANFKMNLLCNAGYFYFGLILFVMAAILGGGLFLAISVGKAAAFKLLIKLGIPIAIVAWGVLRGFFSAIFTKLPEPEGISLDRKIAGSFYTMLDEICEQTKCPKIHYVKLDLAVNAYIAEQPSLGVLGAYKRYLVIGIPLLLMLNEQELRAVIAHECGHLSNSHSKSSVKVYRARLIWEKVSEQLKKQGKDKTFFIKIFIYNYLPALNDMMFSVRKEHEYQADSIAAEVAGKEALASALLKMRIYDTHLEGSFWPEMYKLNAMENKPPMDLFFMMEKALEESPDKELVQKLTEYELSFKSLPNSTHPSYAERLEALGLSNAEFKETAASALTAIFNGEASAVLKMGSKEWAGNVEAGWRSYFEDIKERKLRLEELDMKLSKNALEGNEGLERAYLIEKLEGVEKGLEAYKKVKEQQPDNAYADYNIGRLLVHLNNKEGIELLNEVMEKDSQMIPDCCNELVNYYLYNKDREAAAEYYRYAVDFMETNEDVKKERNTVRLSDPYLPHDLGYGSIERIREVLGKYKEIDKAYIAIRQLEYSGQFPSYILAIKYKGCGKTRRNEIRNELFESHLIPWELWILPLIRTNRELEYKFSQLPDCRIV